MPTSTTLISSLSTTSNESANLRQVCYNFASSAAFLYYKHLFLKLLKKKNLLYLFSTSSSTQSATKSVGKNSSGFKFNSGKFRNTPEKFLKIARVNVQIPRQHSASEDPEEVKILFPLLIPTWYLAAKLTYNNILKLRRQRTKHWVETSDFSIKEDERDNFKFGFQYSPRFDNCGFQFQPLKGYEDEYVVLRALRKKANRKNRLANATNHVVVRDIKWAPE